MSIIKSIKHRLGLSVTPANNFVLDASADNGTMKLARESGQDIMTVDAAGKVGFSIGILGFSLALVGAGGSGSYIKFPPWLGNLVLQFGRFSFTYNTTVQTHSWTLTLRLSTVYGALCTREGLLSSGNITTYDQVLASDGVGGSLSFVASGGSASINVSWLIIGVAA
jgi:hypothetical protein